MDFNIYDIPGGVFRRAKEIVSKKKVHSKNGLKLFAQLREFWITRVQLSLHLSAALTRALPVSGTSQRIH
jgi:hypothetical protein